MDWAFVSYVGVMSVTPGPNNLLLASSGVRFGWSRTVPHVLGISFGHFLQVATVTLAYSAVVGGFQGLRFWLALVGGGYLLYLSWKLWTADPPGQVGKDQPFGFWGAVAFQAINPKAWVMVLNVALLFGPASPSLGPVLGVAALAAAINLPCVSVWALAGDRLRRLLLGPRAGRIFNGVMAALMAGTAISLLAEEWIRH